MAREPEIKNRKAFHNYFVMDKYEAGVALEGCEVKSIREGEVNISDSFVRFVGEEAYVFNMHVKPYSHLDTSNAVDPTRQRKLLLKKHEIEKLIGLVSQKSFSCIPVKLYFKRGKVKLQIALCKGKNLYDKRESLKKKVHDREVDRAVRLRRK